MEQILFIILFLTVIAVQEWRHEREKKVFREREKDLWDRLMAKDFREYASLTKPKATRICLPGTMTDEEMAEEEERRDKQRQTIE